MLELLAVFSFAAIDVGTSEYLKRLCEPCSFVFPFLLSSELVMLFSVAPLCGAFGWGSELLLPACYPCNN